MKKRTKAGRPAKITLPVVEAIGHWIALGMTDEQACQAERVNVKSFDTARRRNPAFEGAIKIARADFLKKALTTIAAGGEVDTLGRVPWTGLAWILERRHKPQFNRTDTHALTDPQGGLLLSPEEFADLEKRTKQRVKAMR